MSKRASAGHNDQGSGSKRCTRFGRSLMRSRAERRWETETLVKGAYECLCAPIEPRQSRFAKIDRRERSVDSSALALDQAARSRSCSTSQCTYCPRPAGAPSNDHRGTESTGMAEDPLSILQRAKGLASAGGPPWRISEGGLTR